MSVLQHFVKHVNSTKENLALIFMDNHCTYINLIIVCKRFSHRIR